MRNDIDEDLLELYDNDDKPAYDYFAASKESAANRVYFYMLLVFMVCIAIKFFQSLSDDSLAEDVIIGRQVELLNVVKNSNDQQEVRAAVQEYDSLEQVLQALDSQ